MRSILTRCSSAPFSLEYVLPDQVNHRLGFARVRLRDAPSPPRLSGQRSG